MSTSEDHGSQLGRSAPPQAPGLWRIDMQQHDLSCPGARRSSGVSRLARKRHRLGTRIRAKRSSTSSKDRWSIRLNRRSSTPWAVAGVSGGRAMPDDSMRTVLVALGAGVGVAVAKAGAAVFTGSAAMAAEAAHSPGR